MINEDSNPLHSIISKTYTKTMAITQKQLDPFSRLFSRFIHLPVVERSSDILGSTLFRPNPILFGLLTSLIFTIATYILAKRNGFALSGSEYIIAFLFGWLLGMAYDILKLFKR